MLNNYVLFHYWQFVENLQGMERGTSWHRSQCQGSREGTKVCPGSWPHPCLRCLLLPPAAGNNNKGQWVVWDLPWGVGPSQGDGITSDKRWRSCPHSGLWGGKYHQEDSESKSVDLLVFGFTWYIIIRVVYSVTWYTVIVTACKCIYSFVRH